MFLHRPNNTYARKREGECCSGLDYSSWNCSQAAAIWTVLLPDQAHLPADIFCYRALAYRYLHFELSRIFWLSDCWIQAVYQATVSVY